MKNLLLSSLLVFGALGSFSVFAETDTNPCKTDRETYCSDCGKEDKECVKKCMKTNEAKLSQKCKEHREAQKKADKK